MHSIHAQPQGWGGRQTLNAMIINAMNENKFNLLALSPGALCKMCEANCLNMPGGPIPRLLLPRLTHQNSASHSPSCRLTSTNQLLANDNNVATPTTSPADVPDNVQAVNLQQCTFVAVMLSHNSFCPTASTIKSCVKQHPQLKCQLPLVLLPKTTLLLHGTALTPPPLTSPTPNDSTNTTETQEEHHTTPNKNQKKTQRNPQPFGLKPFWLKLWRSSRPSPLPCGLPFCFWSFAFL